MTHEQLVTRLENQIETSKAIGCNCCACDNALALRAVVELHKPNQTPDWLPTKEELMCWCAHIYPCPTIQAINKELVNG